NTVNGRLTDTPEDVLPSPSALVSWGRQTGLLSKTAAERLDAHFDRDAALAADALAAARALREMLYAIFDAIALGTPPADGAAARLVDAYRVALAGARLVAGGAGRPWRWQPLPSDEPGQLGWLRWPVLSSAIELLTSSDLARLKRCAGADRGCAGLFVDETRNRSRRWCRMEACGSRAKMRRLYARQRSGSPSRVER
ncbi:MAG: ABATE domain-containing protein, partial [Chloroflexi bacterium]|nr:ABATE domain-containing protein [Chloroflexota bacterium]